MSEEERSMPETGHDSPAGPRWFVSCRYPHLNVTIKPAQDKTPTTRPVKGIYAQFVAMAKPNELQGRGQRERGKDDGTDMNDSGKWGIFGPIMDPGIEPDDGWKDDDSKVPRAHRMKATKKAENRDIIDHLRSIDHYRQTRQNNEAAIDSRLVELNWDPTPFSGNISGVVTRGRPSIGKDGINDNAVPGVGAPVETRSPAPAVKVPSLGRKAVPA